jgi:hypothetical protein
MKPESGEFTDGLDSLVIDAWSGLRRRTRPRQVQRLPNGLQAGVLAVMLATVLLGQS